MAGLSVVVGLGNPGRQYEGTRHNIGFHVIDELVGGVPGGACSFQRGDGASVAQYTDATLGRIVFMKPERFMNLSGRAVGPYVQFHKVPLNHLVVVHDDIDLPVGALRVRAGGGDGGHNGIKSIIASLGSGDFVRVKVGVGRPPPGSPMEVASWVLSGFTSAEQNVLQDVVRGAAAAVLAVLRDGVTVAQNRHNRSPG